MANFNFGDIQEVVCNHLGKTYRFYPKANESGSIDKGGRRTNDDASQITSNGQNMRQINAVRWMVECPIAFDSVSGLEEDNLNLMSGSSSNGNWQFVLITGAILKGTGSPVGDISADTNAGTIQLKVSGGGKLVTI